VAESQISSVQGSTVPLRPNVRHPWRIRIALFVFHIVIVGAALSLTPDGYAFQLGEYTGTVLIFGSIVLWGLLLSAKTRRVFAIFSALALAQAGIMALVGLHFRTEDRALNPIFQELSKKRSQWESQLGQFRMDPLFGMISGPRRLSVAELRELQSQARAGKAKISEVQSDVMVSVSEAERRIGAVSHGAAEDFRRGFDSTRPAYEEQMNAMRDYFTETDQLAQLLIDLQGQYSQTPKGLVFKRNADLEVFNRKLDTIAHLQEQISSFRQSLGR
jgi:hypothetical protein